MIGPLPSGWLASHPAGEGRSGALGRFVDSAHVLGFWIALWTAAGAAELVALLPIATDRGAPVTGPAIVLNLVGGSFMACGLVAWRRRPDSRSGALMTAAGIAFFVPALLSPRDSALA